MIELKQSQATRIEKDIAEQINRSKIITGINSKISYESNTNTIQTTTYSSMESVSVNKDVYKGSFSKDTNQDHRKESILSQKLETITQQPDMVQKSLKNNNQMINIEIKSLMSVNSSIQQEQNLDQKIKWIFTHLIEMNFIQLNHEELTNIINENIFLQKMNKEDILQHILNMNLMNIQPQNTDNSTNKVILFNEQNKEQQLQKNKQKNIAKLDQHLGDERVSEMEDSQIKQNIQNDTKVVNNFTLQQTITDVNEMNKLNTQNNDRINKLKNKIFIRKSQTKNKFLSEEYGGISCSICCLSYQPDYFYTLLSCQHLFCKSCTIQYLESRINTSQVLNIRCPDEGCKIEFTDEILNKILDSKLFEKYKRFKQLKIINQDPTLKWCNKPFCTFYCKVNPNNPKITCNCGHEMCFSCGNNWHEGQTCEEQINKEFEGALQKYIISFCPTCKSKVQKASGCNRIHCPICYKYFCWICRSPNISYAHFSHLNALGCPGKQFSKQNPEENPNYSKIIMFIPRFIVSIIIIACIIIFLPFYFVGTSIMTPNYLFWYYDTSNYSRNKIKSNLLKWFAISTLLFFAGIVLFPICLIPGSCIVSYKIIKNRM